MRDDAGWWLPPLALVFVALAGLLASINIVKLGRRVDVLEKAMVEQVHTREATP